MRRWDEDYIPTEDLSIAGDGDVNWDEVEALDDLFSGSNS